MQSIYKFEEAMSKETAYRRGYTQGARTVMTELAEHLPTELALKLNVWMATELGPWSISSTSDVSAPPKIKF